MTTTSSTGSSTSASTTAVSTTTSTSSTSSNAALGQSILSSLNANGAGIDTNSLVTSLTAAQKSSLETPITTKQTANTAQLSSTATLTSDITGFSSAVKTLISSGQLQTQPTSSNTSVMTVGTVPGTLSGSLSSSITVKAIATAQTVQSTAYDSSATFAAGQIVLTPSSGTAVTVNISANSSLSDVAKAITAQGGGYTASVVDNTLVIKGATGAANAFTISSQTKDADGNTTSVSGSLGALNATASQGFTTKQTAGDADLVVDGVEVTRATNSFSDVVNGVQMNLVSTGTISLGSTRPTDTIAQAVQNLVDTYNQVMADINTATAAATSSSDAGPLRGNAAIRQLKTQLSQLTTTPLTASGSIRTLAELGVKTQQDGTLTLDTTVLSNMLTKYPDDVEAMFITSQSSSSAQVNITSTAGAVASGVYNVTGILTTSANGGTAAGSINGTPMTGNIWNLTAPQGSGADGLALRILSSAPGSATITVNQGLAGALQAISDQLTGTNGALTTLKASLTKQQSSLADALTAADKQVTVYHDRLVTQFTQMNTLVSGYKATQSYLTQQVDLWTKSS
jgi:flagellar hook-associated protein 2